VRRLGWAEYGVGSVESDGGIECEREARADLVASLVAGVTHAMGADSAQAVSAAQVETLFNRQLPEDEKRVATHLAGKSAGKYTREEIEEQMRGMGATVKGEHGSGAPDTLIGETPTDSGAQWISGGMTSDGKTILTQVTAQADPELRAFISTYAGSASPGQVPTGYRYDAPRDDRWGFSVARLTGPFTRLPNEMEIHDMRNTIAGAAGFVSEQAGRVSAAAGSAAAVPGPHSSAAAALSYGAAVVSVGASGMQQVVNPQPWAFGLHSFIDVSVFYATDRYPMLGPVFTEAGEAAKRSALANEIKNRSAQEGGYQREAD